MGCYNCENTICLTVGVDYCNPTIIPLNVSEGIYKVEVDFAGATVIRYFDVTEDYGAIIFPVGELNENYNYDMRIYNSDGDLLNDACYKLVTTHLMGDVSVNFGIYEGVYE